jgi:hypothetical protein
MGTRLIIVHYESLKVVNDKVVLPNGTKEGPKALPEFTCAMR